jgi:hypothetical protein
LITLGIKKNFIQFVQTAFHKQLKMFPGFEKIIEDRIRRAQQKGEFENLEGAGKPLIFDSDCHVDSELRLAYKILKNADCLPAEIQLKKEIKRTEDLLSGMEKTAEKYRTLQKLNFLIMKLNTMANLPVDREMPQKYSAKLVERLEASATNKR